MTNMNDDEYFPCYKPFNIKKGSHYSGFRFKPLWKKKDFRIEVVFTDECAYPSFGDVDDFDINKLYGISWGMHHTNSYRIGWRSDQNGGIILSDYYYVNGERKYNDICTVPTNRNVTIDFTEDSDRIGKTTINTLKIHGESVVEINNKCKWGYTLFPFFGGNKSAPNDMEILLKVIR